jgi:23S rRNA m2A2503 methyltransferase
MNSIFDLTLEELESILVDNGFKKFNATQVFEGIYKKRVTSFDEITNISKELKAFLNNNYEIKYLNVLEELKSIDTNKYLLEVKDSSIEVVLMKHNYGNSICISTQIGCNMACAFCESGKLKKVRNLSTSEIILEVLTIEKLENIKVDNIVVMGIGEPFDNFDNLVKSIKILNCPKGIDLGSRRITVSTCGIVPKIKEFADLDTQVNLAISLHAPNQTIRESLMPISKAYKMDELMSAVDYYISKTNRKVTMEYILLEGINDSIENAKELSNLLKGKLVYVNLIPYNSTSSNFKRSSKEKINAFYDELVKNKINVQMRREMGKGIKGACGQLKASHESNL